MSGFLEASGSGLFSSIVNGITSAYKTYKDNATQLATAQLGYESAKYDTDTNYKIAQENLGYQKENLQYQKDLQQTLFNREDNAVQRAAADMEAAGLSKTLAAGNSANAGSIVSTTAPHNDFVSQKQNQLANVLALQSQAINNAINSYNLDMSQQLGLRTTDQEADIGKKAKSLMSLLFGDGETPNGGYIGALIDKLSHTSKEASNYKPSWYKSVDFSGLTKVKNSIDRQNSSKSKFIYQKSNSNSLKNYYSVKKSVDGSRKVAYNHTRFTNSTDLK